MARKKHRSQLDAIDEINMTPLIDLTFLLLIIFMITAPLLNYMTDVSPPEMNSKPLPEDNTKVISLSRKGKFFFNKVPVTREELESRLLGLFQNSPGTTILVRADGEQPYKNVIELMKIVKHSGFKNISLVTQAEGR